LGKFGHCAGKEFFFGRGTLLSGELKLEVKFL
jgi:hypothetical protein